MSRSPTSNANAKFWPLAVLTLLAAATGLAMLVPAAAALAAAQSTALTRQAQANRGVAAADYQLAVWLNPHNQTALTNLAVIQLAAGQATAALTTLDSAGQGSAADELRVRALLETNQPAAAANLARRLAAASPTDSRLVLAALANAVAGHTVDTSLTARVTAPEALQAIQRAQASKLALATQLYATGLLNSSQRILLTLPQSYTRNLLLARIALAFNTTTDLTQAAQLLAAAITINPASLEAHQLLATVDRRRGDTTAFARQTALIAKLQAGQP